MKRPWLWVVLLVAAGLLIYALAELAGQHEPTVTLTTVPSPTATPTLADIIICHQAATGRIDFCRHALCRGAVCLPGPTVTP